MDYIEIAKDVLDIEANELLKAKDTIDTNMTQAIELILKCSGKVIITGVGKSGLIGAKISATLASTGTSSFFVHPTEAMHGDLGMISANDIVIAISYSGESEELINIMPHLKRFKIPIIGMAKDIDSSLGEYSDIFLNISVSKEACPIDSAPTSSTTLTLAMGDAIAVCLMRARGFEKEDFASFHPGGSLGKKLFVKISDLMRRDNLPIIDDTTILQDALLKMSEGKIGSVLIVDKNDKLVALLSDGDLRRALSSSDFSLEKVALEYATKSPKVVNDDTILASDALQIIEDHKIQLLVITDDESKIKGVLHIHDLVERGIK
jgi:arabinose-5-phosphate isomerase